MEDDARDLLKSNIALRKGLGEAISLIHLALNHEDANGEIDAKGTLLVRGALNTLRDTITI